MKELTQHREAFLKKWSSSCEHDAKKRHCWERRGIVQSVVMTKGDVYVVWQCTQCSKGMMELVEPLILVPENTSKKGKQ